MLTSERLRAWPLTPIHIGDGTEITPEAFTLEGDRLRRFNPFAALTVASEPQREHYRKLLKGGDFVNAQQHLAKLAASGASANDPGIAVAAACLADLKAVLAGRSIGRGRVQPFIRCGEAAILPGSSLKGALRTAWISRLTPDLIPPAVAPRDVKRTDDAAAELNRRVLGIEGRALEQDPFRDLSPRDAPIPAGRTRFDRAVLGKLDRERPTLNFDETRGIQMHVERLDCLADGLALAPFGVQIDFASSDHLQRRAGAAPRGKRNVPNRPLDAAEVWDAANVFHADLWLYERSRFHGGDAPSGRLLDRLLTAFDLTANADLAAQLTRKGLLLLRLGRYSQFESKAVKVGGMRHGVRAGTKGRPPEMVDTGVTRTVVKVVGDVAVPFGWLLMAREGHGPAGVVRADAGSFPRSTAPVARPPTLRAPPAFAPPPPSGPALAGVTKFKKGDRVTHPDHGEARVAKDVGLNDHRIEVDFDGEVDSLPLGGWTRL
jgi:CRISPR-associated protein Csm5